MIALVSEIVLTKSLIVQFDCLSFRLVITTNGESPPAMAWRESMDLT